MAFRTKLDYSDNRQIIQRENTITALSGRTDLGVAFSALTGGPNLASSEILYEITGVTSTFSGNLTTTIFNFGTPEMIGGENYLNVITPSNQNDDQIVDEPFFVGVNSSVNPYTLQTVYEYYTGSTFDITITNFEEVSPSAFTGTLYTELVTAYSASSADYLGDGVWANVNGKLKTEEIIITRNPSVGYVLTALDVSGNTAWLPSGIGIDGSPYFISGSSGTFSIKAINGTGLDATGNNAFATGDGTLASGDNSSAEGLQTTANGNHSHSEGAFTIANGTGSHAEGSGTLAEGSGAHAEGFTTQAMGVASHAEGDSSTASGDTSHAEGAGTIAVGVASHSEGDGTQAIGDFSHAEGQSTVANGENSHTEGFQTQANGDASHAEGWATLATGFGAHTEGLFTITSDDAAHAEGDGTQANGYASHAEGYQTKANGDYSHAEGIITTATTDSSHAEGNETFSSGIASHAEGLRTKSTNVGSHAEGHQTVASGHSSHAEGSNTQAGGQYSHAEGVLTIANGDGSHAGGESTIANGYFSHAGGVWNTAHSYGETNIGVFSTNYTGANTTSIVSSNRLFNIGNGTTDLLRSDALTILKNGSIYAPSLDITKITTIGNKSLINKEYLDSELISKQNIPTGHITGMTLTINPFDNTKVDIASGAYSVTDYSNLFDVNVQIIQLPNGITGITPTFLTNTGVSATYIGIDVNQTIIQQAFPFDNNQRRTISPVGIAVHSNHVNVNVTNQTKAPIVAPTNQLHDFIKAIGFLNLSGNIFGPANPTVDMSMSKTSGQVWGLGINGSDYLDPHRVSLSAQTLVTFRIRKSNGVETVDKSGLTSSDLVWEDTTTSALTLTTIASNRFGIFHGTLFQSGLTRLQYPQRFYTTLAEALANVDKEDYNVEQNISDNGIFRFYLVIQGTTTNFNDATRFQFVSASKFGSIIGGGGVTMNFANIVAGLGYTPENVANKQDSLVVDGTGQKYPTVDAINSAISTLTASTTPSELQKLNEGSGIGWRILGRNPANYGNIGLGAIDFSESTTVSSILGATGPNSYAQGFETIASGNSSHAEGIITQAIGHQTHAEGNATIANGNNSHAEGTFSQSNGQSSHAEGFSTIANGSISHAEGSGGVANGDVSHAEGYETYANGMASHAEGYQTVANSNYSHAGGFSAHTNGTAAFNHSNSSGGTNSNVAGHYSAILGGTNNMITSTATNSVVLGGIALTGSSPSTVYVPSLNINLVGSSAFINDIRIDANGNLTTNTSDVRFKENINPISNALDVINQLEGVTYQWKDRNAGGDDIKLGFIAQQVESIEPKLVFTNKNDGYKGIHIDGIIPLLVEAVKQLSISGLVTTIHTQLINAEDNNIELNINGTHETAIGGGISVLKGVDEETNSSIYTNDKGDWVFSPNISIPFYTPTSSNDPKGNIGNICYDNDFYYIKTEMGWKRTPLNNF